MCKPTWQGVQIVLLGGPIAQGQSVAQATVANWRVESAKGGNRFVKKKAKKRKVKKRASGVRPNSRMQRVFLALQLSQDLATRG